MLKPKLHTVFLGIGALLIVTGVFLMLGAGAQVPAAQAAEQNPTSFINAFAVAPPQSPPAQGDPGRGGYIFSLAGGCGCHMGQAGMLAGGEPFEGPFGTIYPSNITPDPTTGIGDWTDQQIIDAIRLGIDDEGNQLFPIMPYPVFSHMSDQDVQDLVTFLRTVPPVENAVPEPNLMVPAPPFEMMAPPPGTAPASGVARGDYIVNAVAQCNDCHTPMDVTGTPDFSKMLAGSFLEGQLAPNITPDETTGIGSWSEADIAHLLQTGERPNGTKVTGLMDLVIMGGYNNMTDDDAMAVAAYLKTIPAVNNVPQAPPDAMMSAPAAEEAPAALPVSGGETALPAYLGLLLGLLGAVSLATGVLLYRQQQR